MRTGGSVKHPASLANLQPETAPVRHGAHRWRSRCLAPPCSKCPSTDCDERREGESCIVAERLRADLVAQIMRLDHIVESDEPLVVEYANDVVFLAIVDSWCGMQGPFLDGAAEGFIESQPILKLRWVVSNSMVRLAGVLGLTPESRKRIERGGRAEIVWLRAGEDADE